MIQSDGESTSLYVDATPGAFDPATDLVASFTGAKAICLGDILLRGSPALAGIGARITRMVSPATAGELCLCSDANMRRCSLK